MKPHNLRPATWCRTCSDTGHVSASSTRKPALPLCLTSRYHPCLWGLLPPMRGYWSSAQATAHVQDHASTATQSLVFRAPFPNPVLRDPQTVHVFQPFQLPAKQSMFLLPSTFLREAGKNMDYCGSPRTGVGNTALGASVVRSDKSKAVGKRRTAEKEWGTWNRSWMVEHTQHSTSGPTRQTSALGFINRDT